MGHKCLSASTFTVRGRKGPHRRRRWRHKCLSASTFTVREVFHKELHSAFMSQMPIGKYIYCTVTGVASNHSDQSQMPIGKYIYCTI